MDLKISFAKWRPICLGFNVLRAEVLHEMDTCHDFYNTGYIGDWLNTSGLKIENLYQFKNIIQYTH